MISSIVVLQDIRVDGRFIVVEQDFGLSFKVAKIFIGVCPKDLVVGALSVVGQDRKVHHVFFCLLVVDGLRRPYADDVGEHRVSVFFKTEGEQKKGIRQYLAKDLHNPAEWELLPGTFEDTDKAVEGSGVFQRIEGDWVLMYDCYMNGHYQFCTSKDLMKFKRVQDTATQGAFTPRHGTVIAITQKELKRLQKAFPNTK